MTASLLGSFAFITLALAAIGTFGVVSYSVAQRTREIGVRMAIGADRSDILRLILHQAAGSAGIGICAGLLAGFLAGRLINGLLFQTTPTDPISLAISVLALILVTLLAVSMPAARAASVDPVQALRSE
jgi:putative ABC transport system permease protein